MSMEITSVEQLGPPEVVEHLKRFPGYSRVLEKLVEAGKATSIETAEKEAPEEVLHFLRGVLAIGIITEALDRAGYVDAIDMDDIVEIGIGIPLTWEWKVVCLPGMSPTEQVGVLSNDKDKILLILPKDMAKKVASGEVTVIPISADDLKNDELKKMGSIIMAPSSKTLQ